MDLCIPNIIPCIVHSILPSSSPAPAKLGWVSLIFNFSSRLPCQPSAWTSSEIAQIEKNLLSNICSSTPVDFKQLSNFWKDGIRPPWKTTSMEDEINCWNWVKLAFKYLLVNSSRAKKTLIILNQWKTTVMEDNLNER